MCFPANGTFGCKNKEKNEGKEGSHPSRCMPLECFRWTYCLNCPGSFFFIFDSAVEATTALDSSTSGIKPPLQDWMGTAAAAPGSRPLRWFSIFEVVLYLRYRKQHPLTPRWIYYPTWKASLSAPPVSLLFSHLSLPHSPSRHCVCGKLWFLFISPAPAHPPKMPLILVPRWAPAAALCLLPASD